MPKALIVLFFIILSIASGGQAVSQINTIKEYEDIIKHYRYFKPDSAAYFASEAMTFARQNGDSNGVASILLQQGMIDDNDGKFDNSEKKYQQALDIFKNNHSKKGIASTLIRMGVVQLRNGNYDKATGQFLNALKLSEEVTDKFGIMEANYNISWAYLDQKKYDLALQYLNVAEQYDQQIPFSNITLNIYNHYGVIYTYYSQFKKAAYYLDKGERLSREPQYQGLNINILNNLAGVYAKQGLTDKAISLQEEALARSRRIGNYLRELQSLLALSRTYTTRKPQKAIFYLNEAILLARAQNVPRQEIRYLQNITDLYKSQGDYKAALEMKERQYILADSFFYKKMSQNIEALKAEYELSKSNARIKELNYTNNKHQLELRNSILLRNITFAGIAVLLMILGLLYMQYRTKQKSNREINNKNASLQSLVEEKEWLMKEIHHRVKNNLQIVISLLNTQSKYLDSQEALDAIRESTHRMQAMSLIHQKLYQSDNTGFVDMQTYFRELTAYLGDSFSGSKKVRFELLIDAIELDIVQAIPIGLILNETITNSIKHAFDSNYNNMIAIIMKYHGSGNVLLQIEDNGRGLPPDFDFETSNSMGMRLIKGLVKQIGGKLSVENQHGLKITVEFVADMNFRFITSKESYSRALV